MKKYLIAAFVVFAILIGAYIYIKGTPQYSLYQLKNALLNRDAETALLYLDIDSIVDNMMKEVMIQDEPQPKNVWEAAGRNIGKAMAMAMMPAMKETMKSAIKTAITSSDKSTLDNIKKGGIWDFDIKTKGTIATIVPKNDASLNFKMVKTGAGYWKVVEFINVTERNQKLAKLQMKDIGICIMRFVLDNGRTPDELAHLVNNPGIPSWKGPYIEKIENDPWGHPYIYKKGDHIDFYLMTYGKDGVLGGDRDNEDLSYKP